MTLRCPITPQHMMLEIAPRLYQCPECGCGPMDYWSIGFAEVDDLLVEGVCATWRSDLQSYTLAHVTWVIDESGWRIPKSLSSRSIGLASTARELDDAPLPVRTDEGEVARIRERMYSASTGEKVVRKGERGGRSGEAPSQAAPGARSRRRLKAPGS